MCNVWVGVYLAEGSREESYERMGRAPESPLSMGPERTRYATEYHMIHKLNLFKITSREIQGLTPMDFRFK